MLTKRGSTVLMIALIVLAVVLAGTVAFKLVGGGANPMVNNYTQKVTTNASDLTPSDEIGDIEKDLNSTQIDNLDSNVVGITSEVE